MFINLYEEQTNMKPVSHYDYQKAIAMGLVDPENYGNHAKGYYTSPPDDSSLSTMSTNKLSGDSKYQQRVSDATLDPYHGNLKDKIGHPP